LRHGIFTFAQNAREAYERMIEFVTLAEQRLAKGKRTLASVKLPNAIAPLADVAPILRGALAISNDPDSGNAKRQILCFRSSDAILNYVNGADVARYSQVGVVTPDHTIRTKNWPLVLPAPQAGALEDWTKTVRE